MAYANPHPVIQTQIPNFVSDQLPFSPDYLSDVLRSLTGQTTQRHIHVKLVEKAMELQILSQETNQSPVEYRHSLR